MRSCVWVWAFALMALSSAFGAVTFYVSVPESWDAENGLFLVFSGSSRTYTLTQDANGYYTVTYNNSIGGNKTVTVYSRSEYSESYALASVATASVVYLTVDESGAVSATTGTAEASSSSVSSARSSSSAKSSSSTGIVIPIRSSSSEMLSNAKKVRFLSPWTSTTPSIVYNGARDTLKMKAVVDTCDWYEATLSADYMDVIFIQTVGPEVFTAAGATEGAQIALDSIADISNTIWINTKSGLPVLYSAYPKVLGDCPSRKLSVTLYDWLDGSGGNTAADTGTSKDFGKHDNNATNNNCNQLTKGMVKSTLGSNGLPVRNDENFPANCKASDHINHWFLPDTLAVKDEVIYTNATCRDITIILEDTTGLWLGQINKDYTTTDCKGCNSGGAFLLDDFEYLDDDLSIKNPYFDNLSGSGGYHNFGFTMKVHAEFTYVEGQYFDFYGDDDVWVFIDNRLAVDIGGVHDQQAGAVNLDTMRLTPGETYSFDMFYAERKQSESNFRMRTSMDLHTSIKYYSMRDYTSTSGGKSYTIWQNIKTTGLSCDYSATAEDEPAASFFRLYGGNLPVSGLSLDTAGTYYGGITINSSMSGFSIDTTAITGLVPGTYTFEFTSQANEAATKTMTFTIPEPEIDVPDVSIAFADSKYNEIDADTTKLGEWAGIMYPVYITLTYDTLLTTDLFLNSSNANLVFVNSDGSRVTSVVMEKGHAMFYVMALEEVENASFMVQASAVVNLLVWSGITLKEPPVPKIEMAGMYDQDGDGIGDSLVVRFSSAPDGEDAPDSLQWVFRDSASSTFGAFERENDVTVSLVRDAFTSGIFTGLSSSAYGGSISAHYTYEGDPFRLDGVLEDRVGPILTGASLSVEDDISTLTISISEGLSDSQKVDLPQAFEFRRWRSGALQTGVVEASYSVRVAPDRVQLYFHVLAGDAPESGDSVRFVPNLAMDMSHNTPHDNNPWIRITGGGAVAVAATELVTLSPETAPAEKSPTVETIPVKAGSSAEQISKEYGRHGQLVSFDGILGALEDVNAHLEDGETPYTVDDIEIHYENYYFTNLGEYVNSAQGTIRCSDAIFSGDCTTGDKALFLAWNMRSSEGRLVGTGAYVVRLDVRMLVGNRVLKKTSENVWGVRRSVGFVY
ncbi:MAG: fibro-slime domain-containing protein [Fibrobacter sp.]|nr:fibro-slime domain-containing protein [Fibrobacter sp.]